VSPDESPDDDAVDKVTRRLDDALERVAHGAAVSVPSILLQRGLTVVFTAALTNGLGASTYGLFALARRIQRFLSRIVLGFRSGLSRFLPTADQPERNALATFAAVLLLGVSTVFGAGLFLAAP
jgi:O-antigen/teichoic acid export membrane protein